MLAHDERLPGGEHTEEGRLMSRVEELEPLSRREVEDLAATLPSIRVERHRNFFTPSQQGRSVFFVLEGRVRVYAVLAEREFTFAILEAGTVFAEIPRPGTDAPGVYAQAMEPSRVAFMGRDQLGRLVLDRPEVGLKILESLSEGLCLHRRTMTDIVLKEVPARLAGLLWQLVKSEGVVTREGHKITTRYTQEQLGSMIGAKRVAVTRAFAELRRAGVVDRQSRTIFVKDADALKRLASRTKP